MYLGIDLGTSSLKVLLADEKGVIIDSARAEYPVYYPQNGWSEQNPEDWYGALIAVVRELGSRRDIKRVRALSFSGQMHGLVALGSNDKVIRPAILWNDGRSAEECKYLNETVGREKMLGWTGNLAFTGFTAPKVLWLKKREPENYKRIAKLMVPKDYLIYRISGAFASDVSDNSGTLYFDVRRKKWSAEMLGILGIKETRLPKSFESCAVVGTVGAGFAAATGINPKAKVVAGGGDQAVGALGTGTAGGGALSISLGTSAVVFASCDAFTPTDGGIHSFCHADGKYHLMACVLSGAGALDYWLNNILKTTDFSFDTKNAFTGDANGLYFLPYLAGERSPMNDPFARGAFYGINLSHTREDLTLAVVEGISLALRDCFEVIKGTGVSAPFARVIGGGAKSAEWLQLLSDCLNLELRTINTGEGGGLGAIILAAVADGAYPDIPCACKALISDDKAYLPDSARAAAYAEKYGVFKALYGALKTARGETANSAR